MSHGTQTTVHFCCPCGLLYKTTQEQVSKPHSGFFECQDCGKTVHRWRGNYNYTGWAPVSKNWPVVHCK